MLGAMNNIVSDSNHTNDNNTSTPFLFSLGCCYYLSMDTAWVHYLIGYGTARHDNKSPYSLSLCVHVLSDWVPVRRRHFFPFLLRFYFISYACPSFNLWLQKEWWAADCHFNNSSSNTVVHHPSSSSSIDSPFLSSAGTMGQTSSP